MYCGTWYQNDQSKMRVNIYLYIFSIKYYGIFNIALYKMVIDSRRILVKLITWESI